MEPDAWQIVNEGAAGGRWKDGYSVLRLGFYYRHRCVRLCIVVEKYNRLLPIMCSTLMSADLVGWCWLAKLMQLVPAANYVTLHNTWHSDAAERGEPTSQTHHHEPRKLSGHFRIYPRQQDCIRAAKTHSLLESTPIFSPLSTWAVRTPELDFRSLTYRSST